MNKKIVYAVLAVILLVAVIITAVKGFNVGLVYLINNIFSILMFEKVDEKGSKKKNTKELNEVIKKYTLIVIPEIITAFICCLAQWETVYSIGMVMFWGVLISWIYNAVVAYFLRNNK